MIPNEAEQEAYWGPQYTPKGVIAVCVTDCDHRKCQQTELFPKDFEDGLGEMEVNGVAVTRFTQADDCHFLKHSSGHIWKPDSQGRFTIRARALEEGWFVQLSSIILW